MENNWITFDGARPFYARRIIHLSGSVRRAKASVCGLGQFNFYVNGQKVSDHVLDPAWTDYRKEMQYVEFDITDHLHAGENCIAAEVGNGWFIKDDYNYTFSFPAFMPENPNPYRPFSEELILNIQIELFHENGCETICTDPSFKVAVHPVQRTNVFGSELYDGREEKTGWNTVEFDDSLWKNASYAKNIPGGRLVPQTMPPIRIIRTYTGSYRHSAGKRRIYDFSQNMSFLVECTLKGHIGDIVRIFPAEKLKENGDIDQTAKNWCEVNTCSTFILGQEEQTFCSVFSYLAGRYLAVETEENVAVVSLKAHAISSAWKDAGSFVCDDERFNQIETMIRRTVEANMVSVHTDCPTIERFAWQEPNHLMAPSVFFMKEGKALWEKFLQDCRNSQHDASDSFYDLSGNRFPAGAGLIPSQAPCYIPNVLPVPEMGSFYDTIAWGSTGILGAYWHYRFYGDIQIIEDNYDMGVRYLDYLKTKMTPEGFISHGLGDWGNPDWVFARENIETAFLYADTVVLSQFAALLNKTEDESNFKAFAEQIKQNYNRRLLVKHPKTNRYCYKVYGADEIICTQACEALPLYWGMVPEETKDDVVFSLRKTLTDRDALIAGEIGLPYIIQAASQNNMDDLIASCIVKPEHPSYYAFILAGETTLGEYWEDNPRSHCHDMMGHIVEWFYNGIAGIQIIEPGFRRILIRPYLPSSINEVCCTYRSVRGNIHVHLKRTAQQILLETEIPDEIICTIDRSKLDRQF